MLSLHSFLFSFLVFFCVINGGLFKQLPSYIQVCKRDPNTLDDCVKNSIDDLRPRMKDGIPELGVPSMDPLFIEEINGLTADNTPIRATGRNIKVTGASGFKIKKLSVESDTLKIKVTVYFDKLHFEGEYSLDVKALLSLQGEGTLVADAVGCTAVLTIIPKVFTVDGQEYMKFKKIIADITIKDYKVELKGLFNGDKTLGKAANDIINQNKGELLRATKPHLEKTVEKHLLDVANKVVEGLTLDQVLPKP